MSLQPPKGGKVDAKKGAAAKAAPAPAPAPVVSKSSKYEDDEIWSPAVKIRGKGPLVAPTKPVAPAAPAASASAAGSSGAGGKKGKGAAAAIVAPSAPEEGWETVVVKRKPTKKEETEGEGETAAQ